MNAIGINSILSLRMLYQRTGVDDVGSLTNVNTPAAGVQFSMPYETVLELYYRGRVSPWLNLSPQIRYVMNPGSESISNAVTLGLRGQITF